MVSLDFKNYLVAGSINSLLCSSDGMNGGHQTLNNTEVVINNFNKGSQAVGGARCITDNILVLWVAFVVYTHDKHGSISWGSGDDHFLGTSTLNVDLGNLQNLNSDLSYITSKNIKKSISSALDNLVHDCRFDIYSVNWKQCKYKNFFRLVGDQTTAPSLLVWTLYQCNHQAWWSNRYNALSKSEGAVVRSPN